MIHPVAEKRIAFTEILEHDWCKEVKLTQEEVRSVIVKQLHLEKKRVDEIETKSRSIKFKDIIDELPEDETDFKVQEIKYKPYKIDMLEFKVAPNKLAYHAFERIKELFEGEDLSSTRCKVERVDNAVARIVREGEKPLDITMTFVKYSREDIFEQEAKESSTSSSESEERCPIYLRFASRKVNPLKLYNFVDKIRTMAYLEADVFE